MEEPLTSFSDPMAAQRLLAAATLARDSTHYLHGHLLTILGFAELLQEEEAESGRKDGYGASLVHAGQRLRARLDALLYLLSTVSEPPHPTRRESLGGVMRTLLNTGRLGGSPNALKKRMQKRSAIVPKRTSRKRLPIGATSAMAPKFRR